MYRTVVTICTAQWSLYVSHSGHYMYRTVVTICTASLTFNNSTFCPHTVFMCFVWISEQTAIISLYSVKWPVYRRDSKIAKGNYCLHVCPSVRLGQLGSHRTDFYEICYLGIFPKSVAKTQISLKRDKNNGYFTRRPIYVFDPSSLIS